MREDVTGSGSVRASSVASPPKHVSRASVAYAWAHYALVRCALAKGVVGYNDCQNASASARVSSCHRLTEGTDAGELRALSGSVGMLKGAYTAAWDQRYKAV